jgi:cytochrome c oxidase subunit 1
LRLNQYIGIAVAIAFSAQLVFVYNYFVSRKKGSVSGPNPWYLGTLEWTIPSPAPYYNFDKIPTVYNGPHEFSHPKVTDRDFIRQDEYIEGISHKDS